MASMLSTVPWQSVSMASMLSMVLWQSVSMAFMSFMVISFSQRTNRRSRAKTIACARVHTPSLSKTLEV